MSQIEHSKLISFQNDDYSITLKEILDVINFERAEQGVKPIEHNKAMKMVEQLVVDINKDEELNHVEKISTCFSIGSGAYREIETYLFDKEQALAVGARLDNKRLLLLTKTIKRIQKSNELYLNEVEQFLPKGGFLEENKDGLLKTKPVRAYWRVDRNSEASIILQEKYELQKRLNGLMQEEIKAEIELRDFRLANLINNSKGELK